MKVSLRLLAAAVLCAVALTSTRAHAQNEEAMQHYQRGVELYNDGAYDAALLEFERAYKIAPTYKLLYNIGQVNRQLNDYSKALEAYDRYLRDGGAEVPPARKAEVRAEMARISARVARVELVSNARGEVSVDDAVVGTFPLSEPILVNVGKRKFSIKDPNKGIQAKVVDVVAGETIKVDLTFPELAPASSQTSSAAPLVQPPSFPIIPWIATGALGVGTTVTGIIALNKNNDANQLRNTAPASAYGSDTAPNLTSQISSARDSAKTFGIVTDVLLGCTVVSAGVSSYLTIRYYKSKDATEPSVAVTPTLGGATVVGHF
jgi:hypothetical protein